MCSFCFNCNYVIKVYRPCIDVNVGLQKSEVG